MINPSNFPPISRQPNRVQNKKTQMTILMVINNKIIANPEERNSNIDYDQSKPKSKMPHPLTYTNTYNHISLCVYTLGVTMQIHEAKYNESKIVMGKV